MPLPFHLSMGEANNRLPEMQLGLGVWMDGKARFYSMHTLEAHDNALIDTLSHEKLLVFVDPAANVPAAHRCNANSFSWEGSTLILDTGEHIRNGFVQLGESRKRPLDTPPQQFLRWFAFASKFPDCEIYRPGRPRHLGS
jgi:hypothetical protein